MNKTIRTMLAFLMVVSMIAPAMADVIIAEASAEASNGGDTVYTYASVVNPSGMKVETGASAYGDGYGSSGAYGTLSYVSGGSSASSYDGDGASSWSWAVIPEVTDSDSYASSDGWASTYANAGTGSADSNANAQAAGDYAYTYAYTEGNSEVGNTQVYVQSDAAGNAYSWSDAGTVIDNDGNIESNGDTYAQGYYYAGTWYNSGWAWVSDSEDSAVATANAGATGTQSAYSYVWGYSGSNWASMYTYGYGYGQATVNTEIEASVEDI